jgi:hypothetical protein
VGAMAFATCELYGILCILLGLSSIAWVRSPPWVLFVL